MTEGQRITRNRELRRLTRLRREIAAQCARAELLARMVSTPTARESLIAHSRNLLRVDDEIAKLRALR